MNLEGRRLMLARREPGHSDIRCPPRRSEDADGVRRWGRGLGVAARHGTVTSCGDVLPRLWKGGLAQWEVSILTVA